MNNKYQSLVKELLSLAGIEIMAATLGYSGAR